MISPLFQVNITRFERLSIHPTWLDGMLVPRWAQAPRKQTTPSHWYSLMRGILLEICGARNILPLLQELLDHCIDWEFQRLLLPLQLSRSCWHCALRMRSSEAGRPPNLKSEELAIWCNLYFLNLEVGLMMNTARIEWQAWLHQARIGKQYQRSRLCSWHCREPLSVVRSEINKKLLVEECKSRGWVTFARTSERI